MTFGTGGKPFKVCQYYDQFLDAGGAFVELPLCDFWYDMNREYSLFEGLRGEYYNLILIFD